MNLFKNQKTVYKYRRNEIISGTAVFPDGKEFNWTTTDFQNAVSVLLFKSDKLILLKQYRPAIKDWCIEQVAGGLEDNLSVLENAKKEVLEETGYKLNDGDLHYLGEYPSIPGLVNFYTHFFVGICTDHQFVGQQLEETEYIETFEMNRSDFYNMIKEKKHNIDPEIMIVLNLWDNGCVLEV